MTRLKLKFFVQIFCVISLLTGSAFGAAFQFGGLKLDALLITSSGSATAFTKADKQMAVLRGSSNGTFKLPDATGLATGYFYWFSNESTGQLIVTNSGSTEITRLGTGASALFMVTSTATSGGNWNVRYGGGWQPNSVNTQSGTSYTLALTDQSNGLFFSTLHFTSGSAVTVTVPPDSSVAFPVETRVDACQYGAGKVTFSPGSGVTINSKSSNKAIGAQYVCVSLRKVGTNEWLLFGDLIAWTLELLGLKLYA